MDPVAQRQLRQELEIAQRELDAAVKRVEEVETALARVEPPAAEAEQVRQDHADYLRASDGVIAWEERLRVYPELVERRHAVQARVDEAQRRLLQERARLLAEVERLEALTDARAALPMAREALALRRADLDERIQQHGRMTAERAALQQALATAQAAEAPVREAGTRARQVVDALELLASWTPYRETLPPAQHDTLLAAARADLERLRGEFRLAHQGAAETEARLQETDGLIRQLEKRNTTERLAIQAEEQRIRQVEQTGEDASGPLQVALEDLEVVEAELATGGYAPDDLDELAAIDREYEAQGLPMGTYRQLRAAQVRLADAVERFALLDERERDAQRLRAELGPLEAEARRRGAIVQELSRRWDELVAGQAPVPDHPHPIAIPAEDEPPGI